MTPEFESHNNPNPPSFEDSPAGNLENPNLPLGSLDTQKRDRFELLSAYLDGEVSPVERQQVEAWLATDPQVQRLYKRLLTLRQGLQTMPVPVSARSAEQTVNQVLSHLDRRRRQRAVTWGGAAIAATFIAAVSGILTDSRPFAPKFAQSPAPVVADSSEPLMIAINKPLVNIPKSAISDSEKPFGSHTLYTQPAKEWR